MISLTGNQIRFLAQAVGYEVTPQKGMEEEECGDTEITLFSFDNGDTGYYYSEYPEEGADILPTNQEDEESE